jgi:hypothetical protein
MSYRIIENDYERCREFCSSFGLNANVIEVFIGIEKDGELIGCSGYDRFFKTSIQQHICLKPGAKIPRIFWHVIAFYPFVQCGVDMLIGMTPSTNQEALRLAKKYGYVEQSRIKGAVTGGDLVIQTLHKENCKWHNMRVKL